MKKQKIKIKQSLIFVTLILWGKYTINMYLDVILLVSSSRF